MDSGLYWRLTNFGLICLSIPPAFFLPMGTLCSFTGAISGSGIVLGVPALMLWKHSLKNDSAPRWTRIAGITVAVLGALAFLLGTYGAIATVADTAAVDKEAAECLKLLKMFRPGQKLTDKFKDCWPNIQ